MANYYFNKTISRMKWRDRFRVLFGCTLSVNAVVQIDNHTGRIAGITSNYDVSDSADEKDRAAFGKMTHDVEVNLPR